MLFEVIFFGSIFMFIFGLYLVIGPPQFDPGIAICLFSFLAFICASTYYGFSQNVRYETPYYIQKFENAVFVKSRKDSPIYECREIDIWQHTSNVTVKTTYGKNLWGYSGIAESELVTDIPKDIEK